MDPGRSVQFVQRFNNIFVKHRTRFLYCEDEHHHCSFRRISDVRARARVPFGHAQTQSVAPSGGTSFFSVSLVPLGDAEKNCAYKRVLIYFCMRDACKYSRDTVDGCRSYSFCGRGSNLEEGRRGSREVVVQQRSERSKGFEGTNKEPLFVFFFFLSIYSCCYAVFPFVSNVGYKP